MTRNRNSTTVCVWKMRLILMLILCVSVSGGTKLGVITDGSSDQVGPIHSGPHQTVCNLSQDPLFSCLKTFHGDDFRVVLTLSSRRSIVAAVHDFCQAARKIHIGVVTHSGLTLNNVMFIFHMDLLLRNGLDWRDVTIWTDPAAGDDAASLMEEHLVRAQMEVKRVKYSPDTVTTFQPRLFFHNVLISRDVEKAMKILKEARAAKLVSPESQWIVLVEHNDHGDHLLAVDLGYYSAGDNVLMVETHASNETLDRSNLLKIQTGSVDGNRLQCYFTRDHATASGKPHYRFGGLESGFEQLLFYSMISSHTWWTGVTRDRRVSTWQKVSHDPCVNIPETLFPNMRYGWSWKPVRADVGLYAKDAYRTSDGKLEGVIVDIFRYLESDLNFTLNLRSVLHWGTLQPDGSFDGMVGNLQRRDNDLSGFLTQTPGRKRVIDMVAIPHYFMSARMIGLKSVKEEEMFGFTEVYSLMTWIYVLLVAIVVSLTIWVIARCENQVLGKDIDLRLMKFDNAVLHTYGALLSQGSVFDPKSDRNRVVVVFWWWFFLVIACSYVGELTSSLTLPSVVDHEIRSLEHLQHSAKFTPCMMHGVAMVDIMRTGNTTLRKLLARMEYEHHLLHDEEELIDCILRHNGIVIDMRSFLEAANEKRFQSAGNKCLFAEIGHQFGQVADGVGLVKNSAYTDAIQSRILHMMTTGMIESSINRHKSAPGYMCSSGGHRGMSDSTHSFDTQDPKLMLVNAAGLFILLGCGLLFSVVVLIAEIISKSRLVRKNGNYTGKKNRQRMPQIIES